MTPGPSVSLAKIELISHDRAHSAYRRGVSSAKPRLYTATSPHHSTTSSAVRGDASVVVAVKQDVGARRRKCPRSGRAGSQRWFTGGLFTGVAWRLSWCEDLAQ